MGEEKKTRTDLLKRRRAEFLPHPSYDLDGEGTISGPELVVAKRFDVGGKGYLTEEERKKAYHEIKYGGLE